MRAVGLLDQLRDTGVLLATLGVGRPLDGVTAAELPGVLGGGVEVLGEVVGRARAVGAVRDRDGLAGRVTPGLSAAIAGVVPGLDVALEDLGQRVRAQLQLVDAR